MIRAISAISAITNMSCYQDHQIKVILTSKDDWGVVPGERVATIAGVEDAVNSAIEQILQVILVSHKY